jgi:hypothetical protein
VSDLLGRYCNSKKTRSWQDLVEGRYGCNVTIDPKAERRATMRTELLRFSGAVERDPAIDAWKKEHAGELGAIASVL